MIGMALWCDGSKEKAYLSFCDIDGVRFSLILGSAIGDISFEIAEVQSGVQERLQFDHLVCACADGGKSQ